MHLNNKLKTLIRAALLEDVGKGDLTTKFTVSERAVGEAVIIAKEKGILCGCDLIKAIFKYQDSKIAIKTYCKDGAVLRRGQRVMALNGRLRSILTGERVALNFLSLLSGVATETKKLKSATKGLKVKILDTRKTTPNLRMLEKYAVSVGGGANHRVSLSDGIIIKDNHLRAGGVIAEGKLDAEKLKKIISCLRKETNLKIEVEVENFEEFKGVLKCCPSIIMLDNFSISNLRKAVTFRNLHYPKIKLEASGGVNLKTIRKIALTGVNAISVGSITHSSRALDFSLEVIER
ncbi:MAG: carboxylating nicotinate-nucleotide diphosphorylase [Candidatus Omnitrophica bacterium]|nr:carboxylating nicotinate-nucleotide diphosphorylase [Candidatus Omnitrophota bacterium]